MVILGLGSNVGDRLENFRKALIAIKKVDGIQVEKISPIYWSNALLPENAPPEWDMPHLNLAIRCEVRLAPTDLLVELKKIEWSIGRKPEVRHWGPRILDIDILAWDDQIIQTDSLTVPHLNLQSRPFALWPLADIAPFWKFPLPGANQGKTAAEIVESWGSRFSGEAPLGTRQINHRIDAPQLIGIINTTPDSFSDGGKHAHVDAAIGAAFDMVKEGASVLDLGAESTNPKAQAISPHEEWNRLQPVLNNILNLCDTYLIKPKISIDTRHVETAEKALGCGVDWINDVSGLNNLKMRGLIKESQCQCVFMHHVRIPEQRAHSLPRDSNAVEHVYAWGQTRLQELETFGITRDKLIFDPGIGFGKTAEQSWALLQNAELFKKLEVPLLIGHSRKTFLSLVSQFSFPERDMETMVTALTLTDKNIDFLRIHNVGLCARGIKTKRAIE